MIRIVIYLQLITFIALTPGVCEELPEIELPEYVITGIERATRIRGHRMERSISPNSIILPQDRDSNRPALSAFQLWEPPIRPDLTLGLGRGSWSVGLTGGGFGLLNVNGNFVRDLENIIVSGHGWYDNFPHRIEPGNVSTKGIEVKSSVKFINNSSLTANIGMEGREIDLISNGDTYARKTSLSTFSVSTSSIPLGFGQMSLYGSVGLYNVSDDENINSTEGIFKVQHSKSLLRGWLESNLSIHGESWDSVKLFKLNTKYHYQLPSDWFIMVGGGVYTGNAIDNQSRSGGGLNLGLRHPSLFGGRFEVQWETDADFVSMNSLNDTWSVVVPISSISESKSISVKYHSKITEHIDLKLSLHRLDQLHTQFPVLNGDKWLLEPRHLEMLKSIGEVVYQFNSNFTSSLSISSENGKSIGNSEGNEIVQVSPVKFGNNTIFSWSNWMFSNDLQWQSAAPIDFQGTDKRPSRIVDNVTVKRTFSNGFDLKFGINNLFDSSYYDFPGYDQAPLTIHLSLSYKN